MSYTDAIKKDDKLKSINKIILTIFTIIRFSNFLNYDALDVILLLII